MRYTLLVLLLAILCPAYAHVGSPDVVMQTNAGPYQLLVNITPPEVIPGVAKVTVFAQGGVTSIGVRAVYFRTGDEGAPEADEMKAVEGNPGQFTGETWMMNSGSGSVQLLVNGTAGSSQLVVPVVAISTAKKDLPTGTGYLLAGLGVLLFVLMVTIIGASVSDALTPSGEVIVARRKRMKFVGMAIAALCTSLVVYGGSQWWQMWAKNYNRFMYKPTQALSAIKEVDGSTALTLHLDTSSASQRKTAFSFIVPDHGKMMHMFVMRIPAMDAFAHLHPVRVDSATYLTNLPALPKGRYLVFADVVYGSGFTETIKDTFDLQQDIPGLRKKIDEDDAYAFALPGDLVDNPQGADPATTIICGKPGTGVRLNDGSTMVWEDMTNDAAEAGKLYTLKFAVYLPDKQPAPLEPYLGMAGHAAIIRNDGNVYMHLHPTGTYSMAAENNFVQRIAAAGGEYKYPQAKVFRDSIDRYVQYLSSLPPQEKEKNLMPHMAMNTAAGKLETDSMVHNNMVSFPYAFPSPGQYRVWVQVKRNGQVLTAAFDKVVK